MSINTLTRCWSCTDPIGQGYRLKFYLAGRGVKRPVRHMTASLCYPCFSTVDRVFGEKGKGALKAIRADPSGDAEGGSRG